MRIPRSEILGISSNSYLQCCFRVKSPWADVLGQQYSPPPEHDFPMFILATNIRIVAFISNTDV